MRANKDKTLAIAGEVMGTDAATTAGIYDELMPMFSDTGRFDPKALAVLQRSFVEMKTLPEEPDMSKLTSEALLPKTCHESVRREDVMKVLVRNALILAACVALAASADAAEKLRVGKAVPEAFSFVPLDIGMKQGIFAKNGIEVESIAFAG